MNPVLRNTLFRTGGSRMRRAVGSGQLPRVNQTYWHQMKILNAVSLILSTLSLGACVSATIAASGKSYEHLLNKRTTVQDVRNSLGEAEWSKSHHPPVPIKNTEEYKAYVTKQINRNAPFVWNGDDTSENAVTSLCEVYTRQGPYSDANRGQGYGMASGLTLGVGDVLYLPSAINYRNKISKDFYSLTFWYDSDGHFIGYSKGDIRKPNEHRW